MRSEGWEVVEENLGQEKGPDILALSPEGNYYVFECEVEHASSRAASERKALMVREYIERYDLEAVIFIGRKKHEQKFREACKRLGLNVKTSTLGWMNFIKLDEDKLRNWLRSLGKSASSMK
ncbi:MAG: hypothetical protein DRO05_04020 [Thermoproteota archaeon]|nr:MAG: hypothetical protein DRO05_04020 [Candidatus Korarchaeota archaeon]